MCNVYNIGRKVYLEVAGTNIGKSMKNIPSKILDVYKRQVMGNDRNAVHIVQDVQQGQCQFISTLAGNAVTGSDYVNRTNSSRTAGSSAVFMAS